MKRNDHRGKSSESDPGTGESMVPVLDLWVISAKQRYDIRRTFKKARIPHATIRDPHRHEILIVREADYVRAVHAIRDEFESFAIEERAKWERQWRTVYKGSYWRWLTQRSVGRATLAGVSALWWFGF